MLNAIINDVSLGAHGVQPCACMMQAGHEIVPKDFLPQSATSASLQGWACAIEYNHVCFDSD